MASKIDRQHQQRQLQQFHRIAQIVLSNLTKHFVSHSSHHKCSVWNVENLLSGNCSTNFIRLESFPCQLFAFQLAKFIHIPVMNMEKPVTQYNAKHTFNKRVKVFISLIFRGRGSVRFWACSIHIGVEFTIQFEWSGKNATLTFWRAMLQSILAMHLNELNDGKKRTVIALSRESQ